MTVYIMEEDHIAPGVKEVIVEPLSEEDPGLHAVVVAHRCFVYLSVI